MKTKLTFLILSFLSWQTATQAAGFDCSLTNLNETEKTICGNSYLSGLDNITNKFFVNALQNTLSRGTLQRSQNQWLKERNACAANVACIKETYLQRNAALSSIKAFHALSDVFPNNFIDTPFDHEIENKNGFTIRDNPWLVKELFNKSSTEDSLNLAEGDWRLLTHLVINNDLAIIFTVERQGITYLVLISDVPTQSYVIASHDTTALSAQSAPNIELTGHDDTSFSYQITYSYNPTQQTYFREYFRVKIDSKALSSPQKIAPPSDNDKEKSWTGYCGEHSCYSELVSPDGQWRLASGEGFIGDQYDGVYYFPYDRPDLGVNVFTSVPQNKEDGWNYSRNYTWGHKNSFFFDNDGGLACIWKTDIDQKTTERILPVEGLKYPYYIRYNNEDYIVTNYISNSDDDNNLAGFYITKANQ